LRSFIRFSPYPSRAREPHAVPDSGPMHPYLAVTRTLAKATAQRTTPQAPEDRQKHRFSGAVARKQQV
ncbi:MAG: hypothetical protein MUC89_09315, partial [Acetobacteraceae bacterium]|nr:hypothetical protein [Acetobacteraceae bacterium]